MIDRVLNKYIFFWILKVGIRRRNFILGIDVIHFELNQSDWYHERFFDFFHEIDTLISVIKKKLKDHDKLIILIDYSMELIKRNLILTHIGRD